MGWLGAVAIFLALSVAGLAVDDAEAVRAAYLAMDLAVWSGLVPFAVASLVTGVVQGLGTSWGLFRHYWVLIKLLLTLVATFVLLMYTQTIGAFAELAEENRPVEEIRSVSPVLHAGAAVVVLLTTTALAVFKPRGLTKYGWRKQQELRRTSQA